MLTWVRYARSLLVEIKTGASPIPWLLNNFSLPRPGGIINLSSPRAKRAGPKLRAQGLLLYSRIPQWEGGRLFEPSAKYFYGNSCNSGTESQKMVSKVGN